MDKRIMDKLFKNKNLWIKAIQIISDDMKNYDGSIFYIFKMAVFIQKQLEVQDTYLIIILELSK